MEKQRVYLDASTISLLDQKDLTEKMEASKELWELFKDNKYDVYISEETIEGLNKYSPKKCEKLLDYLDEVNPIMIDLNDDVLNLAEKIRDLQIVQSSGASDSIHLAAALNAKCDYLVSWNYKHLVNPRTKNGIARLIEQLDFKQLEVPSPFELLGLEEQKIKEPKIKEPKISPDLTVDDIHAIREYEYELTKDMNPEEFKEYYKKKSEEAQQILEEWRKEGFKLDFVEV